MNLTQFLVAEAEQRLLIDNQLTMIDPDDNCEVLTVSQYAHLNGVHKHTVLNWIRAGKIRAVFTAHGKYVRYYIPIDTTPPLIRPEKSA